MDEARLSELQEERIHLLRCCEDLVNTAEKESRIFTDEEKTKTSSWRADLIKVDKEIKAIEDHQREVNEIRTQCDLMRKPGQRKTEPEDPSIDTNAKKDVPIFPVHRYGALKAFKGKDAEYNAYTSGMWLISTLFGEKSETRNHPLVRKGIEWSKSQGIYQQIQAAMSTGIPSGGGNLVPDVMSQTIIDLREMYGILRQWATVLPMSSDSVTIPRVNGNTTAYFTPENTAGTQSQMSVNQVKLTAQKLMSIVAMSTELSEDAVVSMTDLLTRDIAWAFALKEDTVGFNGTGISTDGGIIGITSKMTDGAHAGALIDIAGVTHNLFSEVDATDLTSFMGALPQYALGPGCAWFCSQLAASTVFGRLMATAGGNNQNDLASAGITALGQRGIVGFYLGYPIVASQVLPAGAATDYNNAIMMLFGNMAMAVTIGERRQITFAISTERYFLEDQIAIKATSRLDINAHDVGGGTGVRGPLIALYGSSS